MYKCNIVSLIERGMHYYYYYNLTLLWLNVTKERPENRGRDRVLRGERELGAFSSGSVETDCNFKMKKSFMVVLFILTVGHAVECFNDTCDYTSNYIGPNHPAHQYLCGDVCLNHDQPCDCGGQRIRDGWSYEKYCCAPASACTRTQEGASCSSGEVLSWKGDCLI